MIRIEMSRKALIKIVSSMSPSYEAMRHPLIKGTLDGSYMRWSWSVDFETLSDKDLVTMLVILT